MADGLEGSPLRSLLAVRAGAALYALPIAQLLRVTRCPPVTRAPVTFVGLVGLASVSGRLVVVGDLSVLGALGVRAPAAAAPGDRPSEGSNQPAGSWLALAREEPALALRFDDLLGRIDAVVAPHDAGRFGVGRVWVGADEATVFDVASVITALRTAAPSRSPRHEEVGGA